MKISGKLLKIFDKDNKEISYGWAGKFWAEIEVEEKEIKDDKD